MSLDAMLAEGARNQIKAHNTYEGAILHVSGTVEHSGLQGLRRYVRSGDEISGERVTYAYAMLAPDEPSRGRLLCYFEPHDRAQVEDLEPGQRITVSGLFNRFRHEPVGLVVQLDACDVEQ